MLVPSGRSAAKPESALPLDRRHGRHGEFRLCNRGGAHGNGRSFMGNHDDVKSVSDRPEDAELWLTRSMEAISFVS